MLLAFRPGFTVVLVALPLMLLTAQDQPLAGKPIGSISTHGDLVVLTLDEGALGHANLFDLAKHTLRFTPESGVYRVENVAFNWDPAFGEELPVRTSTRVALHEFAFPFSGRNWDMLTIDATGSIGFGGGVTIGRFDQLQNAARALVTKTPAICVFMKPRMSGARYVKALARSGRHHLDPDRTGRRHPGFHLDADRQSLSSGAVEGRNDSDVVRRCCCKGRDRRRLSGRGRACGDGSVQDRCRGICLRSRRKTGRSATVYESFHYLSLPNPRDLTCTVLKALGDKFDFLAYYSDFRIDNQEAGTPSNGPLGGGPLAAPSPASARRSAVSTSYCTPGDSSGSSSSRCTSASNQMQEQPPDGLHRSTTRTTSLLHASARRAHADGKHSAVRLRAVADRPRDGPSLGGVRFRAGRMEKRSRWARRTGRADCTRRSPFPFQRPTEASAMGGGVWQDNFDGTFTQLDDDYYVPATGCSYLDLYLMGCIAPSEVPDFFILRNLAAAGRDANGRPSSRPTGRR